MIRQAEVKFRMKPAGLYTLDRKFTLKVKRNYTTFALRYKYALIYSINLSGNN